MFDVAGRFAEVVNRELKGRAAAGADWIGSTSRLGGKEMAPLFNLASEGVK